MDADSDAVPLHIFFSVIFLLSLIVILILVELLLAPR